MGYNVCIILFFNFTRAHIRNGYGYLEIERPSVYICFVFFRRPNCLCILQRSALDGKKMTSVIVY